MPTIADRFPPGELGENYFVNETTGEVTFLPSQTSSPSRPAFHVVSPGRRLEDPLNVIGLGRTGQVEDPFGILPGIERQQLSAQQSRAFQVADYLSQFLPADRVRQETVRFTGFDPGDIETPTTRKIRDERIRQENIASEIAKRGVDIAEGREDILKKRRERQVAPAEAHNTLTSATQNLDALAEHAGRILNDPALWRITGPVGTFPDVPGSAAADLRASLSTLEAKSAFNVLQSLRDASKTGGALGNVSNFEIDLLKNALAAIKTSQSPRQFRESLQEIINYTQRSKGRLTRTFEESFGDVFERVPRDSPKFTEGQTATGPGGRKIIFRGGKWQPM